MSLSLSSVASKLSSFYSAHKVAVLIVLIIAVILVYLFMDGGLERIQKIVDTFAQCSDDKTEKFQDSARNELYIFYADWCGYCQRAKGDFEKVAKQLASKEINGKKIEVRMVNGDKEPEITKDFDVKGYPTVILVKDSRRYTYEGSRTEKEIMTYLESMMRE
jgi:thiol-disulfide isomerase/thioredoxin